MDAIHLDPGATLSEPQRIGARFGLAFTASQLTVMAAMAVFVLPRAGAPGAAALERGANVLDAQLLYRLGNFALMTSGMLLLGFLGVVHTRLRETDGSGALATVAVASGTLLALIWPLAGMLHDVAIDAAEASADPRILAGWDSVAPFGLALSAMPRLLFVGAIVLCLRRTRARGAQWLRRGGTAVLPLSLAGSATLVHSALFPVLAVSTLAFQLWVGAVAWYWLHTESLR